MIKRQTSIEELTKDMPDCMFKFMTHVSKLEFKQKPDYNFLKGLFDKVFKEMCFKIDNTFCWQLTKEARLHEKTVHELKVHTQIRTRTDDIKNSKAQMIRNRLIEMEEKRLKEAEERRLQRLQQLEEQKKSSTRREILS